MIPGYIFASLAGVRVPGTAFYVSLDAAYAAHYSARLGGNIYVIPTFAIFSI